MPDFIIHKFDESSVYADRSSVEATTASYPILLIHGHRGMKFGFLDRKQSAYRQNINPTSLREIKINFDPRSINSS